MQQMYSSALLEFPIKSEDILEGVLARLGPKGMNPLKGSKVHAKGGKTG
jgi:hypothetical protein